MSQYESTVAAKISASWSVTSHHPDRPELTGVTRATMGQCHKYKL